MLIEMTFNYYIFVSCTLSAKITKFASIKSLCKFGAYGLIGGRGHTHMHARARMHTHARMRIHTVLKNSFHRACFYALNRPHFIYI